MPPRIEALYRYPVKGLSPEPLSRAALAPGMTIPGDRLYAIENGDCGFDPAAPRYLAKTHFLMLMKNERLARLRTRFDDDTHTLTVTSPSPGEAAAANGSPAGTSSLDTVSGDLRTAEGRARVEDFFARYCADELRGRPKILHAPGHSFSDVAKKVVSIINLASVAAIERLCGTRVDPLRFRANMYVEGWPAWHELDLVGQDIVIRPGENSAAQSAASEPANRAPLRLRVVKRIVRCAAVNVDPGSGLRDMEIPRLLMQRYGHIDCGIYAEVKGTGEIAPGDLVAEG